MAITGTSNVEMYHNDMYSAFVLRALSHGDLPQQMYRNVTDFSHGGQLNIPSIGTVTLQDVSGDDDDFTYNPIETGRINMSINEAVGDAFYVQDKFKEDGSPALVPQLIQARTEEAMLA